MTTTLLAQALDALESPMIKTHSVLREAIRAHLAAQPAPVPVPPGWMPIEACIHHVDEDGIGLFAFARAIEAAHGIAASPQHPAPVPVPVPPGWTAVSDKMPPEDVPCWLYEAARGAWIGGRSSDSDGWLWHNCYGSQFLDTDGEWDSIDAEADDDYQPTHWMPLPPPPGIAASPENKL